MRLDPLGVILDGWLNCFKAVDAAGDAESINDHSYPSILNGGVWGGLFYRLNQMHTSKGDYMTIKELSEFTGKNRTTIERWCAKCTSNIGIMDKVQNAHYTLEAQVKFLNRTELKDALK